MVVGGIEICVEHALEGEAADIRGDDVINNTTTMMRVGNRQTERAVMLPVVLAPWIILVMQVETVIGRGVDYRAVMMSSS